MHRIKKLFYRNFRHLSALKVKFDQKPKEGKSEINKYVRSVGGWIQFVFFWSATNMVQEAVWESVKGKQAKNRFETVTIKF